MMNMEETFQKVSLNGSIDGKGFRLEDADFRLKAEVTKVGINQYNFENISTDARLAKEFFEGKLDINDPNFIFNAEGTLDLRNQRNKVRIDAVVDTINFHMLNYSQVPFGLKGKLDLDFTGLTLDKILGEGSFNNATIFYNQNQLYFESLNLETNRKDDSSRYIFLNSEYFDLAVDGEFTPSEVIDDLIKLKDEYLLEYRNQEEATLAYYKKQKELNKLPTKYNFSVLGQLKSFNPFLELFLPDWWISDSVKIQARFHADLNSVISVNTFLDTLKIGGNTFENLVVNLDANKIWNQRDILAMAYINSEKQYFGSSLSTEDLFMEGIWSGKHIDLFGKIKQQKTNNHVTLSAELDIRPGVFDFHVIDTDIALLEKVWQLDDRNQLSWNGEELRVDFWKLSNDRQELLVSGEISPDPQKELFLSIRDVSLELFNPLLDFELQGVTNGFVALRDYFQNFQLESELEVYELTIDDFLVGNLSGFSHLLPEKNSIEVDYTVTRKGKKTVSIGGFYHIERDESLEMMAKLNDANLDILEPFLSYVLTQISGTASGEIAISGVPSAPILTGEGLVSNAKAKVNYLNTIYSLEGKIVFDANLIGFDNIKVIDDQNNVGFLNGGFFHDGFRDFVIDLNGNMNNVKVLSTTAQDNDLFYGTAIVDGNFNILGPINNLLIRANAISKRGTRIFVPLSLESGVEQEEYITFKSKDTVSTSLDIFERLDLSGIRMDFDFEITPDAYCEIIFDLKAGDIIRGRGNGKLKMLIDTNGDFNMFGDYVFQEGGYNFTLYNFINKEFQIQPESKISWFGNPYEAIMDITATYEQMALLGPILTEADTSILASPALKRRYPAKVFLDLDGPMLKPDIAFNINVSGYPDNVTSPASQSSYSVQAGVEAFRNRLVTDEQYLKKQVFSLIILRRFSPENTFNVGAQSVGSSVSEFISNQVSYWIAQVDENLEIDVDLAGLSDDQFQTFQLRLAYTFLDGRLRISRDGTVAGAQQVDNELAALAGDWTVEYLLTNDGKYRVKMYNRTNYNTINAGFDVQQTAGFSILQTQSFDRVREIFVDTRNRNRPNSADQQGNQNQEDSKPEVKKPTDIRKEEDEG